MIALMNIHYAHPTTQREIFLKMHLRRIELSNYRVGIISQTNHTVINLFAQSLHA